MGAGVKRTLGQDTGSDTGSVDRGRDRGRGPVVLYATLSGLCFSVGCTPGSVGHATRGWVMQHRWRWRGESSAAGMGEESDYEQDYD